MLIELLKEMFEEMVVKKDASLIPKYYHEQFVLITNEKSMSYYEFLDSHIHYYQTPIRYEVSYDEGTLLESEDKVAGRMWITTSLPGEKPKRIEVMLIAQYLDKKLYRLWELTYPDWSKMAEFAKE